jgi:hypothetical protein
LTGRAMAIEAEGPNGGFYGLIGGFASPADTARFCAAVGAAGHGCVIRRSG